MYNSNVPLSCFVTYDTHNCAQPPKSPTVKYRAPNKEYYGLWDQLFCPLYISCSYLEITTKVLVGGITSVVCKEVISQSWILHCYSSTGTKAISSHSLGLQPCMVQKVRAAGHPIVALHRRVLQM